MSSPTMPGGARTRIRPRPLVVLVALLASALLPINASAAPNPYDVVTEYATSPVSSPAGIVTGPDGKIWYAGSSTDTVVQVDPATGATLQSISTLFGGSPGCMPIGLTIGPDRNLWTACFLQDYLVRITTAGVATQYRLPTTGSAPWALTPGPDGALWFTEEGTGKIARLDTSSFALSEFALPAGAGAKPRGIAVGSDGNLWFTESGANLIGRITTGGTISEYSALTANSSPFDITMGPDFHLYYTESTGDHIGKIDLSGGRTEFVVPTAGSSPHLINVGPDGNLWFTYFGNKIGSMTPAGIFQDFSPPTVNSHPFGITTGPDGNVWFTESGGFKIAKVGARHGALFLDHTGVGFGQVVINHATGTQRVTLFNTGAEAVAVTAALTSFVDGFSITSSTCTGAPVGVGSSCAVDVQFMASHSFYGGLSSDTLVFTAGLGTAAEQRLSAQLWATIVSAACSSVTIGTDLSSPQNVGATVTLNATSSGCPNANPLYRFYVRGLDGVWTIVRDYSTSTSFVWNTTGYERGTYLLGVWVKDASSPTFSYDAYAYGTFTLALPSCSSTNLSPDVASPRLVGATVTFTATSIGCPSALYQWWVRDTGGVWSIVPGHDFAHSSNTFAWNTSSRIEGTYQVGVWARQTGSLASYDAFALLTYTLTISGPHCTTPQLVANQLPPRLTGSTITFTASAAGCSSPLFRFYIRDVPGVWHVVQDYSNANTYTWSATSSPVNTNTPGTYLLGVWVKAPGSANTYDDFDFITFPLVLTGTCTVHLSSSPASGAQVGTAVTWTALSDTCISRQFRFWVKPPNGDWTMVQDYGPDMASGIYHWTAPYVGTFQVGVWIRQSGSPTSYDNWNITTFTVTPTNPPQVCGSVVVTSDVSSPQVDGTTVTFTAAANGCSTPQYQWWVRVTSANWAIVQDFAHSSATFVWNTTGLPNGTYLLGVWARQLGSSASYEAYSFVTYTLTLPASQAPCSSVSIAPNIASPQAPGTTITFTATALGCGSPDYRFFIAPPGAAFGEVQPFGAPNTLTWNTPGLVVGPYQVGVWARRHGSTASYEAFAFITFQLAGNPCTTLAVFPTNATSVNDITSQPPQPVGLTITWPASAGGCSGATYQFFLQAPSSFTNPQPFNLVQGYSGTPTYVWNTAGLARGTYQVLVNARFAGSSSLYETAAVASYEVV